MRRGMWLGVLLVSVFLVAAAGFGMVSSGGPDDIGSTAVVDTPDANASTTAIPEAATPAPVTTEAQTEEPASTESDTAQADPGDVEKRAAAAPAVPDTVRSQSSVSQQGSEMSVPVRLKVDDVGLDAPLDQTGVRDDGLMEIPDDGDRAGWYRYGPAPGAGKGSVVLAGHVDTKEGLGAMAALREVNVGAIVTVEMADGGAVSYEIVGRETVAKDDLLTAEIFDRAGPERLTMITCGGPWRSEASSYRDNVVVVATPLD